MAAVALGIGAAVLASYVPGSATLLNLAAGGLIGSALPQLSGWVSRGKGGASPAP